MMQKMVMSVLPHGVAGVEFHIKQYNDRCSLEGKCILETDFTWRVCGLKFFMVSKCIQQRVIILSVLFKLWGEGLSGLHGITKVSGPRSRTQAQGFC